MIVVYIDDVIVFSRSLDEHLRHVDDILDVLQDAGVSIKLKKCDFCSDTVKYLGHILRPGNLSIDEVRVKSLTQLQHPRTITELRSFLGLCNLYRRFLPGCTDIAAPLNQLLKKGMPTNIGPLNTAQREAFATLERAVTTPPVLALPKDGRPFSLDTDVSDYQVGAALFQSDSDGTRKPIGY